MTNFIQKILVSLRRKLGYPEVSILVMGNNLPATRNRVRLLRVHTSLSEYILDSYLTELPYSDKFKFKQKQFTAFEGILYLIDATKEEMIKHERNFFWEKIIWDERTKNLPVVVCAYNSNLQGALTRGELIENLSLIRLTDRLWELFETPDVPSLLTAIQWMKRVIHMGYVKPWEEKEKLLEKIKPIQVQLDTEKEENQ
ncbi:MAG: ADP-ribosylation factor-like protein [Candidatus Heimdallarchaeaceae archaeon]